MTMKKDLKIDSVNSLYLIFGKMNRYVEVIDGKVSNASSFQWKQRKNKKVWRTMDENQRLN